MKVDKQMHSQISDRHDPHRRAALGAGLAAAVAMVAGMTAGAASAASSKDRTGYKKAQGMQARTGYKKAKTNYVKGSGIPKNK